MPEKLHGDPKPYMAKRRLSPKDTFVLEAVVPNRLQAPDLLHDGTNVALLRLLRDDPRLSVSELEDAGVVRWRIEIDPRALGFPVSAYVRVRPAPGQLPKVAELAQRMPQVTECHRVTGEDCFMVKIHVAAIDQLDAVLDQFLAFGQTTTSLVQSTPVPPRLLPLPDERT
jgi:Lrp/AsnC family leucine-responsive transcriptional regulator